MAGEMTHWLRWVVIALALTEGGWFAFDGARALVKGDYLTPQSGPYAGQLGPWSKVVSAVGIEPRSTLMKSIHVAIGVAWILAIVCYWSGVSGSWYGMVVCAMLGLWYVPFGTLLSVVQIVLLSLGALRFKP